MSTSNVSPSSSSLLGFGAASFFSGGKADLYLTGADDEPAEEPKMGKSPPGMTAGVLLGT